MPAFVPQRYEQILPRLIARVIGRSGLSDVSPTSILKHILAAVARALEQAYYQASLIKLAFSIDTATGSDLDARAAEIQPATISRLSAQFAKGYVVFSRNSVSGSASVAAGQGCTDSAGNVYVTTAAVSWSATSPAQIAGHAIGQDSPYVPVLAQSAGASGNVAASAIAAFSSKPTGVDTVINPAALTGGSDIETDDSFRSRIKAYIAGLSCGTPQSLESAVRGAQDGNGNTILYAKCYENLYSSGPVILYIDDGTGSAATQVQVGASAPENVTGGLQGPSMGAAQGGETGATLAHTPATGYAVTLTSSQRGVLIQGSQYTLSGAAVTFVVPLVVGEVVTARYVYTDTSGATQTVGTSPIENLCAAMLGTPQTSAVGGESRLTLDHVPMVAPNSLTLISSVRGLLSKGTDYLVIASQGLLQFLIAPVRGEVITAQYTYYTGLVAVAQKIVDGDPTNPTQYPGVRSAGIRVDVNVPQILEQNITGYADTDLSYNRQDVQNALVDAISGYINGLSIGADVLVAEIISAAMGVPGCLNYTLTGAVTTDVVVLDTQMARVGTIAFAG